MGCQWMKSFLSNNNFLSNIAKYWVLYVPVSWNYGASALWFLCVCKNNNNKKKGVWFSLIPNTLFMQRLVFKSYHITAYDGVNHIISLSYFVEAGNKMELVYEGSFWKIIRQQIPAPFFYIASSS